MEHTEKRIELVYLTMADYEELRAAMQDSYLTMPGAYWREHQIQALIDKFPEGQVVIKVDGKIAGCSLSLILDDADFEADHTYREITIKAEATPNTEMILIADVDIDLLSELHNFGSVKNLKERRLDLFDLSWKPTQPKKEVFIR